MFEKIKTVIFRDNDSSNSFCEIRLYIIALIVTFFNKLTY